MTTPTDDTDVYAWAHQPAAALRITAMAALQVWAAQRVAQYEEQP
jgi:hypothetical protein